MNKPSGLVVHRGWSTDKQTVYDMVRDEIVGAPIHTIHRLDRGTSGVLLFALDPQTADFLQRAMREDRFDKKYIALVRGPMRDRWFVNHAIKQPPDDARVSAMTEFKPLAHSGRWTLVQARPITGRTHQIRLHARHLSHPIIGDVKHGKGDINRHFREAYNFNRLALHAHSLTFPHPDRDEEIYVEAPLPLEFARLLQELEMPKLEINPWD